MAAKASGKTKSVAIDLDARAAESKIEAYSFRFGGERYEFPPRPDVRFLSDLAKGDARGFLNELLGPDQTARMKASPYVLDTDLFEALLEDYFEHAGIDMGKASLSFRS